jgi:hypothetical protein
MDFAIYPMVVDHLVDYLSADELLGASSSVYLLYGAGSAVGPLIAGAAMDRIGPHTLPLWFAVTTAILAVYAAYRYQAYRCEQVAENNFRPMLHTTGDAIKLTPEAQAGLSDAPEAASAAQ